MVAAALVKGTKPEGQFPKSRLLSTDHPAGSWPKNDRLMDRRFDLAAGLGKRYSAFRETGSCPIGQGNRPTDLDPTTVRSCTDASGYARSRKYPELARHFADTRRRA
jgi:hypothetical protein